MSDEKDDFDRLLDEFIESELEAEKREIGVKKPSISDMRFFVTSKIAESDDDANYTLATHFRPIDDEYLIVKVFTAATVARDTTYQIYIKDMDGRIYAQDEKEIIGGTRKSFLFFLTPENLKAGFYKVIISCDDKKLYEKSLVIEDIPESSTSIIELLGYSLYRINNDDEDEDFMTMMERGSMNCFNINNLREVASYLSVRNKTTRSIACQFLTNIYDNTGKLVVELENTTIFNGSDDTLFEQKIYHVVDKAGTYRLKITFFGEVFIDVEFVVGLRDVSAAFLNKQVQPRQESHTKGILKDATLPMARLNSMVGLGDIKKKLLKIIAKMKIDQERTAKGLPSNSQQLHMVFLGNPGTGKTTVAKLLGQIYKEIGVLSQGHVVMEERSTLMTQNWGGEGECVNKAIEKSRGGVLFIDEAYDLVTEHKSDPGRLIISSLLSAMGDDTNRDWMVILAGYSEPMERLLNINPGVKSRIQRIYFSDYDVKELMQIADLWLDKNCYTLTADARKYLESLVNFAYTTRDEYFGNGRYITNLLENEIQPAMAERLFESGEYSDMDRLTTIEACDIPNPHREEGAKEAIDKLGSMVGLDSLKGEIRKHLSFVRFLQARRANKLDTSIPPLHMVFTGNPGTGKSSVAEYIGEIYRSLGIISQGNVIKVTRSEIIDSVVGGTEAKMKNILAAAHGNVLFIDEAYTLFEKSGGKDFGKNAVDALLDTLGKEVVDMIVILAGYPKEMDELLDSNPGLKGRFPYRFNFEDYDEQELYKIAEGVVERKGLTMTSGAKDALKAIISRECKSKDSNFSNARFIVRLITTKIIPNMACRLEGEDDPIKLSRIVQKDVPIDTKDIKMINSNLFDEEAIEEALSRLDGMVGLTKVKLALHRFVDFARALNAQDPAQIDRYSLRWNFAGNTGTGKSSVAEILAQILKAMHLLESGHIVEVKAEELYGAVNNGKANSLLTQRMKESLQGLLFVDGDAPEFVNNSSRFDPEYLRMFIAANINEIHGRFAVVMAEYSSEKIEFARSVEKLGISNFDQTLIFEDYSAEELFEIFKQQIQKLSLTLEDGAAQTLRGYIESVSPHSNARTMAVLSDSIRSMAIVDNPDGVITADMVASLVGSTVHKRKLGF